MNHKLIYIKVLGLVSLVGCVPSLNPIYTDADLIFEPALVGIWHDADEPEETWRFASVGDNSYHLVVQGSTREEGIFRAHLAQIEGVLFLDLYPQAPELKTHTLYDDHIIRAHTFFLVEEIGPELRLRAVDEAWLSAYLTEHPDALSYVEVEGGFVVTASTEEIQRFVLEHVDTDATRGYLAIWRREE